VRSIIKGWWHVISAVAVLVWLGFGWVQTVNASIDRVATLEETSVRKDVLNETMLRIEAELKQLNDNWKRHYEESPNE